MLALACASAPPSGGDVPPKEIVRTDVPYDLSGEWNDVDADLVAKAIIEECLKGKWAEAWSAGHEGRKPVVRLYPVRNRTTEYIDYRYFTKQIEAALVSSSRVEVVAAAEEARSSDASDGEIAEGGAELGKDEHGADFVLNGWIISQEDKAQDQEIRAYLTSIEIIETASHKKAWVGQKRIRKLIKR